MPTRSDLRALLAPALVVAALVADPVGASATPRVHVRGSAHIEARAARDAGEVVLTGALLDDARQPLAGESVAISLTRGATNGADFSLAAAGVAKACAEDRAARFASAGPSLLVAVDEAGRFCVRLALPQDRYAAKLAWGGSALVVGANLELPLDVGRRAVALRFDPEPRAVRVDEGAVPLGVLASYEEEQTTRAAAGLHVVVTNERGDTLGEGVTSASGAVRFTVPGERVGPPGPGALRATGTGGDDVLVSPREVPLERRARVHLEAGKPRQGKGPDDEATVVPITARTGMGGAASGSVQARLGEVVVGAATLEGGAADLVATFAPPDGAREATLRVTFQPSAPWFERGDDLTVRIPITGPSPLRHVPLALAGLAVLVWLALGRARAVQPRINRHTLPPKAAREDEARVEVVRATRDARAGWSGRVVDAHEGTPVRGARVRVERPGFERASVIVSAFVNDAGRFELRSAETDGFDELVVDGPLHSELRQPLPPCGVIEIQLVSRKRRLLERLVRWARGRGRPFDATPEATPGHVRRAAGQDLGTVRWADAVERAAYAGGDVDARQEADIERLAPGAARIKDPGLTVRDAPPDEKLEKLGQAGQAGQHGQDGREGP